MTRDEIATIFQPFGYIRPLGTNGLGLNKELPPLNDRGESIAQDHIHVSIYENGVPHFRMAMYLGDPHRVTITPDYIYYKDYPGEVAARIKANDDTLVAIWKTLRQPAGVLTQDSEDEYTLAEGQYVHITTGIFGTKLNHTDEGLIVDTYLMDDDDEDYGNISGYGLVATDYCNDEDNPEDEDDQTPDGSVPFELDEPPYAPTEG